MEMDEPDALELLLSEPPPMRNWAAIYARLQRSLWYSAAQGARRTGVRDPEAIQEAALQAFREFMKLDFDEVVAPGALARRIAYLRGIDQGKATRRRWRQVASTETISERHLRAVPDQPDGVHAGADEEIVSAEELREREQTYWRAKKCLGRLTDRQRHVIKEHVMRCRALSDVGHDLGISHTAVRKLREKALPLLLKCLEEHDPRHSDSGGEAI
jgi:RNA polymerase sigma factor (sigma-70 family)